MEKQYPEIKSKTSCNSLAERRKFWPLPLVNVMKISEIVNSFKSSMNFYNIVICCFFSLFSPVKIVWELMNMCERNVSIVFLVCPVESSSTIFLNATISAKRTLPSSSNKFSKVSNISINTTSPISISNPRISFSAQRTVRQLNSSISDWRNVSNPAGRKFGSLLKNVSVSAVVSRRLGPLLAECI